MEKEFVPYELALRMKQLGFEEPCVAHWFNNVGIGIEFRLEPLTEAPKQQLPSSFVASGW